MNDTQAILKLVAKFGNIKDLRMALHHVQFIKDFDNDTVKFYASNGHIAIRVTRPNVHSLDFKEAIKIDSINRAVKVDCIDLLTFDDDIKFPNFERVFTREDQYTLDKTTFDCKYLALIFQSIETFRKDLKMKIARVTFEPLSSDKANFMTVYVNQGLSSEIKIDIAIMPIRG